MLLKFYITFRLDFKKIDEQKNIEQPKMFEFIYNANVQ